ncbi:hypothetical protein [Xenorhabdus hominickii]|uniref:Uncharacterized protein n=1 Tax=Xenorhabdus hominickii TaxID=351679 RepID=A0A2G0Q9V5_XENHO|nr:hypothetical protein [Xenorhabdus hominickii]AOM41005.1 hypothetical protein A9255_10705 [Xenorhabdus hominickii]PHM56017.1 hypothetical protein Xhom_01480 [Xenorhabdus hominickii]
MAAKLLINLADSGTQVIKGQPFSVSAKISGETGMVSGTTTVTVINSTGAKLLKIFPSKISQGICYQQLIFLADESAQDCDIKFSTNTVNKPTAEEKYKIGDNPALIRDTCVVRGASTYLYDPTPVELTGDSPTTNPYISASINPMIKKVGALSKYEIPIRTTAPLRIFTVEGGTSVEILPYDIDLEKQYYYYLVNKPSIEAVNLKIYATLGISRFVGIETIFNQLEFNQKQTLFINTIAIDSSSSFDPPIIEETYTTSDLTRPDEIDHFHFMIPHYSGAKSGDFIIGFVSDDESNLYKKQLCFGQLEREQSGYYKLVADYGNLYDGDNIISYVALDEQGEVTGSKPNIITYDSGGNNSPNPNDISRTLVAPEVYDQFGVYLGMYQAININSVGTKGLEVRLLSDLSKSETTIVAGDTITITAYISYCVDTQSQARPLQFNVIESHPVKQSEISDNYYKINIPANQLMGFSPASSDNDGTLSIDYLRVAQNQKSKMFVRSFGTARKTDE